MCGGGFGQMLRQAIILPHARFAINVGLWSSWQALARLWLAIIFSIIRYRLLPFRGAGSCTPILFPDHNLLNFND